jgi:hypothetical protein
MSELYPDLNDNEFNIKISRKKEFIDSYNNKKQKTSMITDIIKEEPIFSLKSHQLFLKNFMSRYTPYKTLLLYHGLGTGKTCSALGIAFEKIKYMISTNEKRKIIIVSSPNIKENFKKQIYDEQKANKNNNYSYNGCLGDDLMKIINPFNNISSNVKLKEKIREFIDDWFIFIGYVGLSNQIKRAIQKGKLVEELDNRLIIIDEIHNIRSDNETEKDKVVLNNIQKMVENTSNLKLLLLSATPMFHSYSEIIWLINLMNMNDNRPIVNSKDIFNENGTFVVDKNTGDDIGKKLFIKKITGYISFVEGNSPFTFPFRLYPNDFSKEHSILNRPYPIENIDGDNIIKNKNLIDYYVIDFPENSYQKIIYEKLIEYIKSGEIKYSFTNVKDLSILNLLNIIYPSDRLINSSDLSNLSKQSIQLLINNNIGKIGLKNIFKNISKLPFEYKNELFVDMFKLENIGKYSAKINSICLNLQNVKEGVSLIYSNKIYGGIIPMCLALEEMGYSRLDSNLNLLPQTKNTNLKYIVITGNKMISKSNSTEIESATKKENVNGKIVKVILISEAGSEGIDFKFIRNAYIMDPWYNMNKLEQVIGRCIREKSHHLLPLEKRNCCVYLYAMYLNEKIETIDMKLYRMAEEKEKLIGNISRVMKETSIDCLLQSNTSIEYSKGQIINNVNSVNIKIDDNAGELQVGSKVKTTYNGGNKLFNCEVLKIHNNGLVDLQFNGQIINMKTSHGLNIQYMIEKIPYSSGCDYMDNCNYKCSYINNENSIEAIDNNANNDANMDTFTINSELININSLKNIIRDLFNEKYFYNKYEIIKRINFGSRNYNIEQIETALNSLINNKLNSLVDKYNRRGDLIKVGDIYLFQPLEIDNTDVLTYDRSKPLLDRNDNVPLNSDKSVVLDEKEIVNIVDYDNYKNTVEEKLKLINKYMDLFADENSELSKIYQDNENIYSKIIKEMYFDKSSKEEKLNILNHKTDNIMSDIINNYVEEIFGDKIIILGYSNKDKLIIGTLNNDTWILADDNSYYMDKLKNKYGKLNLTKSKPYYGISGLDNNNKSVFKIKSDKKSGVKGENCLTIKSEFNSIFDLLLGISYDKIKKKVKNSKDNLCFIIEFLLRYKNIVDDSKTWFIKNNIYCLMEIL